MRVSKFIDENLCVAFSISKIMQCLLFDATTTLLPVCMQNQFSGNLSQISFNSFLKKATHSPVSLQYEMVFSNNYIISISVHAYRLRSIAYGMIQNSSYQNAVNMHMHQVF